MSNKLKITISMIIISSVLLTACESSVYPFDADGYMKFNVEKGNYGADITYKNTSGKYISELSYILYTYAENGVQLDSISFSDSDLSAGDERLQTSFFTDYVEYAIIVVVSIDFKSEQKSLNIQSQKFEMK